MSLSLKPRLTRDRMRRRRIFKLASNVTLICLVAVLAAYVITRQTGSGFNPSEAMRKALSLPDAGQTHAASRTTSVGGNDGAKPTDDPVNYYGYKLRPGPYRTTEVRDMVLRDARRDKDLHLRIFYPQATGRFPVIVFSHGAGGSQNCCEALTAHWASYGYVTIQPTHADSAVQRRDAGEENMRFLQAVRDALQQPGLWESRTRDVSFVLDSLGEIARLEPLLAGKMDLHEIGAGGHSMGSFTTEALAGALVDLPGKPGASLADSRVQAALCLSPQGPGQFGLTETSFRTMRVPFLGVTGSLDSLGPLASPQWHRKPFEMSPAGDKYELLISGANHMSFISARTPLSGSSQQTENILDYTNSAALAFWDAYLKNDSAAREYLQSDALASFSKGAAQLERRFGANAPQPRNVTAGSR
jgi:predicted dienelactone hydrolase